MKELERAHTRLGMRGVMLFSNVNGTALADCLLMPLVGFLMDTTLAASTLVFAGVPKSWTAAFTRFASVARTSIARRVSI